MTRTAEELKKLDGLLSGGSEVADSLSMIAHRLNEMMVNLPRNEAVTVDDLEHMRNVVVLFVVTGSRLYELLFDAKGYVASISSQTLSGQG